MKKELEKALHGLGRGQTIVGLGSSVTQGRNGHWHQYMSGVRYVQVGGAVDVKYPFLHHFKSKALSGPLEKQCSRTTVQLQYSVWISVY